MLCTRTVVPSLSVDGVYGAEPVIDIADTVRRVIEKERPDSLLASLGGQTGLTIAMQLHRDGTLQKYHVRLLGSDIDAIEQAEDREQFTLAMQRIGQPGIDAVEDLQLTAFLYWGDAMVDKANNAYLGPWQYTIDIRRG